MYPSFLLCIQASQAASVGRRKRQTEEDYRNALASRANDAGSDQILYLMVKVTDVNDQGPTFTDKNVFLYTCKCYIFTKMNIVKPVSMNTYLKNNLFIKDTLQSPKLIFFCIYESLFNGHLPIKDTSFTKYLGCLHKVYYIQLMRIHIFMRLK